MVAGADEWPVRGALEKTKTTMWKRTTTMKTTSETREKPTM